MHHLVIILGNVGKDPEMRYTPQGQAVTSFSVATNRQYNNAAGEKVKETIWFRVTAWGKHAEICNQYVKKGQKIYVEGRLNADKTTGGPHIYSKQDGTAGATFEVISSTVRFIGGAADAPTEHQQNPEEIPPAEEDIPF